MAKQKMDKPQTFTHVEFHETRAPWNMAKIGKAVRVRLADPNDSKTYAGIYLGDLPRNQMIQMDRDGTLNVLCTTNPAMWVPDLNRVVWGCESWWGTVEEAGAPNRPITDQTIEDTVAGYLLAAEAVTKK